MKGTIRMRKRYVTIFSFLVLLGVSAAKGERLAAPFVMPPSEQPEQLIAGMDLEGPSALVFDSRNRPYMFESREPEHFGYLLTLHLATTAAMQARVKKAP
jgi:hypothetical protein